MIENRKDSAISHAYGFNDRPHCVFFNHFGLNRAQLLSVQNNRCHSCLYDLNEKVKPLCYNSIYWCFSLHIKNAWRVHEISSFDGNSVGFQVKKRETKKVIDILNPTLIDFLVTFGKKNGSISIVMMHQSHKSRWCSSSLEISTSPGNNRQTQVHLSIYIDTEVDCKNIMVHY